MMDLRPANSLLLFRFLTKSYPGSCPTALGPAVCAASPAAAPAAGYETRQPQEADGNPCCVLNPLRGNRLSKPPTVVLSRTS